eukprot:TRINITY_DN1798_c0_g1_i2.p1 TRINITY_DN1798_c0_g1~~TRINITY_DN1798_c0_g1_i2.p1  ORF type:complete len:169 (-),score=8.61 TRINITY_DN1798_c0_g1_i2:303-809(-)
MGSFFFFFLMIRRPPRSTHCISSAASDVYKRQNQNIQIIWYFIVFNIHEYRTEFEVCQSHHVDYSFVYICNGQVTTGTSSQPHGPYFWFICHILQSSAYASTDSCSLSGDFPRPFIRLTIIVTVFANFSPSEAEIQSWQILSLPIPRSSANLQINLILLSNLQFPASQ